MEGRHERVWSVLRSGKGHAWHSLDNVQAGSRMNIIECAAALGEMTCKGWIEKRYMDLRVEWRINRSGYPSQGGKIDED